jgi:hypothetical protein
VVKLIRQRTARRTKKVKFMEMHMQNIFTEAMVFKAKRIRTRILIQRGWFGCGWSLPENTYLDFVKVDVDGRRVYKCQLSTTTLCYKKGDSAGFRRPQDCFDAIGF